MASNSSDPSAPAPLLDRAASLEMLDGLLSALTGVLDVRQVFDRVSDIAARVISHDAMAIALHIPGSTRMRLYASRGFGSVAVPPEIEIPDPRYLSGDWDHYLLDDMSTEPASGGLPSVKAGMVSVLATPIRLDGRLIGTVNVYSRTKAHFTRDDADASRRIADCLALALSHQRLAEEARRAAALQE